MSTFSICGLQLEIARGDNVALVAEEIDAAVRRFPWLQMVVLGELSAYGSGTARAEPPRGPAEQAFRAVAARHGIWLVPGSFYVREDDGIYNTTPVIAPDGTVVARHRKLFPFLPYEAGVTAGREHVVFDVPGVGRFGVSNCYDMWFPETTRTLAALGAEVVLHPSMTNTIDRDAELAIARANAAVNQCFFVDVNVAGALGLGRSIACGPGGEVLHQAGAGREVFALQLDLELARRARRDGWNGLGQVLKSFRDRSVEFPAHASGAAAFPALQELGPLRMPGRRS